jgi:bifunctional ADP-heptose synthase (sugar kinase/adenylyltransferase)
VRWVTGHFDPLLVDHARRIHEFVTNGQMLVVVVTNPEHPLLPQRARAELVAALAGVDYVVMKAGDTPSDEPEDAQIQREFIQHVLERHAAGDSA